MIAYLKGQVLKKIGKSAIINCNNVGYAVNLTLSTLETLTEKKETELFIYTKVREDDISLYGFTTTDHLDFFKDLLSVNGIGPKSALEIMNFDLNKTKTAILQENKAFLTSIPGLGKKTAERLILDLKGKITPPELMSGIEESDLQTKFEDAISALSGLGYQRFEIVKVLKSTPPELTSTEELITYFLKNNN